MTLAFSVDASGAVTDVKVEKGVSHELNHEAVRVVMESPKWTPAMYEGKPFKVHYIFPVKFFLKPGPVKI